MTVQRAGAMPVVSIITVVYNGARFVEETLTSVLAQQDVTLDYHVIDGGSTDGTVEIIRRYADRLAGWVSEPDQGIADAFNKGIARARGDYLMFLNADDALAHPRALAELLEHAAGAGWPDVVYGDFDLYDPDTGARMHRISTEYARGRLISGGVPPHPRHADAPALFRKYGLVRHLLQGGHGLRIVPARGSRGRRAARAGAGQQDAHRRHQRARARLGGRRDHSRAAPPRLSGRLGRDAHAHGLRRAGPGAAHPRGLGLYRAFDALRRRKA